jgi:phytoene dehydrogenase-like protein
VGQTAVVVGAGFAGIATSAVLARNGFDVVVLEKNRRPGGRAMVYECDAFRFDMGPSWYLMPEIFERFFEMFGQSPSSYYQLVRLDPSYRVFLRSGRLGRHLKRS